MRRLIVVLLICLPSFVWSQTSTPQPAPTSDPQALSLVQQSVGALTRGATISDVTLNANVTSILGSDYETGTGTFQAKGTAESRMNLSLSGGTRSEVRNLTNGLPSGAWQINTGAVTAFAHHNCFTDAAWFFPALSSLVQNANSTFIFKYVGLEQHGGVNTQHVRVFQVAPNTLFQHLSKMDFFLDPASFLPLAIVAPVHPDLDASTDIPSEIRFANYQSVNGVLVPFHFQRLLNGGVVLDVNVTSATFNTGLSDRIFSLP